MDFDTGMNEATTELMEKKSFAGMDAFAESYSSLEKSRGQLETSVTEMKGAFNLPSELSAENLTAIHAAIGVPADVSGYEVKYDGDTELDSSLMDSFKAFALQEDVPTGLFSKLVNFQIDAVVAAVSAADDAKKVADEAAVVEGNEAIKKAEAGLMSELGDKYESTMTNAADAAKALGLSDLIEAAGKASDPDWLKTLNGIYGKLSEGTLKPNKEVSEATKGQELKELIESKAFKDQMDPGHKAALAQYNRHFNIG